jgi:hypothetical protein
MTNKECGIERKVGKVKVRVIARKGTVTAEDTLRCSAESEKKWHLCLEALTVGYRNTDDTALTGDREPRKAEDGTCQFYRLKEVRNLIVRQKQRRAEYQNAAELVTLSISMPIHFLQNQEPGFLIPRDGSKL